MRRDVFQAIADPVRRDIIDLLAKEPLTVNSVAEHFSISRPAISKHLKILDECGLVAVNKQGRQRLYSIQPQNLETVADWVGQFQKLWVDKLDSFESYLDSLNERS